MCTVGLCKADDRKKLLDTVHIPLEWIPYSSDLKESIFFLKIFKNHVSKLLD